MEDPKNRPSVTGLLYKISSMMKSDSTEEDDDTWDYEMDLGPDALPVVTGAFVNQPAAPVPSRAPVPPQKANYPNYSSNLGGPGVKLQAPEVKTPASKAPVQQNENNKRKRVLLPCNPERYHRS